MDKENEIDKLHEDIKRLRAALSLATADLSMMLRLRGFRIHSMEPQDDLLIPSDKYHDKFYETLKKYSFRLFLRDVIKNQEHFTKHEVTRYATSEVTGDYIDYLLGIGLIEKVNRAYRLSKRPIKSFGATLEWFVAETFRREFMAETIWGVEFKGQKIGGDYDVISSIEGNILYMEVKSSPPKQVYDTEIEGFLDRLDDLNPSISIFFMDTELRMKDKIVPMFEVELRKRFQSPPVVSRMEMELFQISERIYIINAKYTLAGNIEKVLSHYFRSRNKWEG